MWSYRELSSFGCTPPENLWCYVDAVIDVNTATCIGPMSKSLML